jgi:phosphoribosylformylglycinamidine cyclo-ligase
LIGGETAEMPDMYAPGEYDLAGFCVGAVEKSNLIDGSKIKAGDAIIGIASSGPHSNGYSLIRKIAARAGNPFEMDLNGTKLADALMAPTTIYVKPILQLLTKQPLHGMAHITGGGLTENIIRVVPDGLGIALDSRQWKMSAVFDWLQREGNVAQSEMWRTFNCGIGFTLIVGKDDVNTTISNLRDLNLSATQVGEVVKTGAERVRIA